MLRPAVPHRAVSPRRTRPCRALCPPDARLPHRQAAHSAQTKRNAQKHQHQRGNGRTRRQARHRRCPQTRQQGRSRFRSARKAQTQAEIIAPITEATKQPTPPAFHEAAEWGSNKYIIDIIFSFLDSDLSSFEFFWEYMLHI